MSDVVSISINGDDVVGEYSTDDPIGIRRYPYGSHPPTYGDVAACVAPGWVPDTQWMSCSTPWLVA